MTANQESVADGLPKKAFNAKLNLTTEKRPCTDVFLVTNIYSFIKILFFMYRYLYKCPVKSWWFLRVSVGVQTVQIPKHLIIYS